MPSNYKVLFLQGGATGLFAAIPLNLLPENGIADYLEPGAWSNKAIKEGKKYGQVNIVAKGDGTFIPDESTWKLSENPAYFHYCNNETIHGVEFNFVPQCVKEKKIPLVCDMSSDYLSRPVDVSQFGVIYGGAQKNIGPAGVTVAIVRDDLIGKQRGICPSIWNFKEMIENDSMLNTPPCYAIYISGLVFQWMLEQGGLEAIFERNKRKAAKIYDVIDNLKDFYVCPVQKSCRSLMNIPFRIKDNSLEDKFVKQALAQRMDGLKGHRSVGGMRASIYNAVTEEAVDTLVDFMQKFAENHKA